MMTAETAKTMELFKKLHENLTKSNELLVTVLQTYVRNVEQLIQLGNSIVVKLNVEGATPPEGITPPAVVQLR
jgi:uncharacterized protein (DUF362 family)